MSKYKDQYVDLNNENVSTTKIINLVGKDKKVLDVGCSSGYVAKVLKEQFGCTVTGIEIDPEDAKLAESHCERVIVADLEVDDWERELRKSKFDVIILADILEHLKDPLTILKKLKNFLKTDGYLAISIPNIAHASIRLELLQGGFEYEQTGILDSTHLKYFTKSSFIKLLHNAGLKVSHLDSTTSDLPEEYLEKKSEQLNIPEVSLTALLINPEALAYQYIWRASTTGKEIKLCKNNREKPLLEVQGLVRSKDDLIKEMQSALDSKDQIIVDKDNAIKDREKMICQNTSLLQERMKKINNQENLLQERIEKINEQENLLEERMEKINEQYSLLEARSEIIKTQRKSLESIFSSKLWKVFSIYKYFTSRLSIIIKLVRKSLFNLKHYGLKSTLLKIKTKLKGQNTLPEELNEQYTLWLKKTALGPKDIRKMKNDSERLEYKPLISVIMPVYNVKAELLNEAIKSVQDQIYTNWELCIADDASTMEHIKPLLKKHTKTDKRIKVKYLKQNQHISGSSNEALALAKGEFIALLDNDDLLTPDALYECVKALNKDRSIDMIYSDEDKLEPDGRRTDPNFKPDWSPDMLLAHMYTCHLGVYRKSIIEKIRGFRKGYEGSQDYDLVLRFTEQTDKIHHIPKILYQWRKIPGSTADPTNFRQAKSYAYTAARKSLEDTVKRRKLNAEVIGETYPFRIKYEIKNNPKVSIIIPIKDKINLLMTCLKSIEEHTEHLNYEVLVIDNNSEEKTTEEYLKQIKKSPKIKVYKYKKPFNFSAINNFAVDKAQGEYILFLNNDTEVLVDGWLTAMLEHAQRENIGAVGAKLLYPDMTIQHAGLVMGLSGIANSMHLRQPWNNVMFNNNANHVRNVSAVTAACLLINKDKFLAVGGFDEKSFGVQFNDVDLCLKLRKEGYFNIYTPFAILKHFESISRGFENNDPKENQIFTKKWGQQMEEDPYYNPNLTKRIDFEKNLMLNIS